MSIHYTCSTVFRTKPFHYFVVTLEIYAIAASIMLKLIMWLCNFSFAGTGQHSRKKLEFKNRLSIALGAAKGDPLQNQ